MSVDAKVSVDTLVQLIEFPARGVIKPRFNTNPIQGTAGARR